MSENLKIVVGYAIICLLWGSTWLAIRLGLDDLTPLFSSGVRFLLASVFIFIAMKIKGIKMDTDPVARKIILLQTFFSFMIPFGFVYWAEQYIESALASLLFGFFPFSVIIFSRLLIKGEQISLDKALAIILGFLGVGLIFSEKLNLNFSTDFVGILLVVISAVIQAFVAVIIKRDGAHLNPLSMNLVPLFFAGLMMTVSSFIFEDTGSLRFSAKAVSSILYLAFFGTITTFTIYYWLMKKISVVILSLISFITPIISVILGFLILDEKLSFMTLLGGSIVVSGIFAANYQGLKKYFKGRKAV